MIILRPHGGLGNQLFAYAAARRLALFNEMEMVIDHVSGFSYDTRYHRQYQLDHFSISCRKATSAERLIPFGRLRRYILRSWNSHLPFEQRKYLVQEGINFDKRLLELQPLKHLYIEGYWQSEGYFKDVEKQIRQDLRISPPKDDKNNHCFEKIRQSSAVALHVRFFDNPATPGCDDGNNASNIYYARAIREMEERVSNAHYFVFSDRPDLARTRITLPDDRITFVNHNEGDKNAYADLWLMSQCKHFIIANSTFSWWGAWLAEHDAKIVIAPGYKKIDIITSWGFDGLLPDEWIKL
jgi:hypothetical protein